MKLYDLVIRDNKVSVTTHKVVKYYFDKKTRDYGNKPCFRFFITKTKFRNESKLENIGHFGTFTLDEEKIPELSRELLKKRLKFEEERLDVQETVVELLKTEIEDL